MAHFNLTLFNHADGRSYLDIIANLRAMILDLGHEFSQNVQFLPPPAINLVMEGFDWPSLMTLQRERIAGRRIVLIVTEMATRVSKKGFLWTNRVNSYWGERAYTGRMSLRMVDACWCLVTGTAAVMSIWGAPSFDIELGYSPRLVRSLPEPTMDFCFFGSQNERRHAVVDELKRRGFSVVELWEMPLPPERDAAMAKAKIVLDVKLFDWWPVVSSSRIQTALHCGRPIICERRGPMQTQHGWDTIALFERRRFLDEAIVERQTWKGLMQAQLEKFMHLMPADIVLAPAMAPTLQIMSNRPRQFDLVENEQSIWSGGPPRLVKSVRGINLVSWNRRIYYVPQNIGPIDIDTTSHPRIRIFETIADAEAALPPN